MIVADASAVIEFLLGSRRGRAAERAFSEAEGGLQAPALLDVEVAQAVRRLASAGVVTDARGRATLELLQAMPLRRHVMAPLLPRIWVLRDNLSAYDASYVALAEALDCPLVTFDKRIASASGHRAQVVVPA